MEKIFITTNLSIPYRHVLSTRGRSIRFTIRSDGSCLLTTPKKISQNTIDSFLVSKQGWIVKKLRQYKNNSHISLGTGTKEELAQNKEHVKNLVTQKLKIYQQYYPHLQWSKVIIRNQSTRWGSCSKKGTLSFNYKIGQLPIELVEYVVVHELCHLQEMNHSYKFWNLVKNILPNYKVLKKTLNSL